MKREEKIWLSQNNAIVRREAKGKTKFSPVNKVWITGILASNFKKSKTSKKFYQATVQTIRYSGIADMVPIIVEKKLLPNNLENLKGKYVELGGIIHTKNVSGEDGKRHLCVNVLANEILITDDESKLNEKLNTNIVYLEGYICKPVVYRKTPSGRSVTDVILACNSKAEVTDYIPSIAWGNSAIYLGKKIKVGYKICLWGRFQSRNYFKRESPDSLEGEVRQAYEISIILLNHLNKNGIESVL